MGCNGDLVGMGGKASRDIKRLLRIFTTGKLGCHKATHPWQNPTDLWLHPWLVGGLEHVYVSI